jgi:hypothetical protein
MKFRLQTLASWLSEDEVVVFRRQKFHEDYLTESSEVCTYSRRNRDFPKGNRNNNESVKRNPTVPHDTEKRSIKVQHCSANIKDHSEGSKVLSSSVYLIGIVENR